MSLTVDSGQTLQRCLALDIGGTKIASAIVKNGEIQHRKQISTPQDDAAQAMHQTLAQLVKEYEGQFDYVAVASTGIINQGILTALNPKNLGGLAQFPLKDSIAQHTDKPIGLLNDVQAAAYAEYQLQNPNDVQNFTFITVSTGVGGGLILNHRLLTEPNGIAGHIAILWPILMVPFAVVVAVAASKPLHQVARLKRFLLNGMILVIQKKSLCVSAKMMKKQPHL
mgnify:CR=1 FL=1